MVKAVSVSGSETWAVTEMDRKRLGTWNRKILRRIIRGPAVEKGIWRTRSTQEQTELYKDPDIATGTKKKRLEWTGHVERMD